MTDLNKKPRFESDRSYGLSTHTSLGLIAVLPGLSLIAFWFGGELAMVVLSLALPIGVAFHFLFSGKSTANTLLTSGSNILAPAAFDAAVKVHLEDARITGAKTAIFMMEIDDYQDLLTHHGQAAMDSVVSQISSRVRTALRNDDDITCLTPGVWGVCLSPQPRLDLEICLEIAGRMSRAIAEPFVVDGTTIYLTVATGFCQLGRESTQKRELGKDPVVTCAKLAMNTAKAASPGAIRAYSPESRAHQNAPATPGTKDALAALENGEIVAWFQPQISTDTGEVTGFEALARWMHPAHGVLPPSEFIPQIETAGRMGRLSEVILFNAFSALRAWDQAGVDVKHVGVNFSTAELSDPKLVDKLQWEMDRFDLAPSRLAIEILETVVACGPDDVIARNVKGLSAMGCQIDLDDFGTGHASLSSIRRFAVSRIKIDRSFVMKADRDPEQQRMIRAILTMAEKLELETVAEGVETVGEHSLLAQLGCTHVQGFGIGRPMPFEQTMDWIKDHNTKLHALPNIGRANR